MHGLSPAASFLLLAALVAQPGSETVVLSHATLINPGALPRPDTTVVVSRGRISAVGATGHLPLPFGAPVLDLTGKFIIPGLADMHHHMGNGIPLLPDDERENLHRLLAYGITTVFSPGTTINTFQRLKQASREDAAPVARFFGTGPILTAKGGHVASPEGAVETPEEARAAVRKIKALGADAVKMVYDDTSWLHRKPLPKLAPETAAALIDEAHKQGLKVYVHAPILRYAKEVLRLGADGMVHGIISDPIDDEFISLMKRNAAFYVGTQTLFECADPPAWIRRVRDSDDHNSVPQRAYFLVDSFLYRAGFRYAVSNAAFIRHQAPVARANLKRVHDAGIPVVAGTDSGPAGLLLGITSQIELALYVEAGLTPAQALETATINAARVLGLEQDLGSVEAGKRADLVVLDANPLVDIRNIRRIHRVVKGGNVYDPAQVLASRK